MEQTSIAFPLAPVARALVLGGLCVPVFALADQANPICPNESVFYEPGRGEDIVVPAGYRVKVFWRKI